MDIFVNFYHNGNFKEFRINTFAQKGYITLINNFLWQHRLSV